MGKYYRDDLTYEEVAKLLEYDPVSGVLKHKVKAHNRPEGTVAGRKDRNGYLRVRLLGRDMKAHRLAWLLAYKQWPAGEIDHRNGCTSDNRLENLRDVSVAVNGQNRTKAMRNNKTGVLGVCFYRNKFIAQIKANGKHSVLGRFATLGEARAAYQAAKEALHESA